MPRYWNSEPPQQQARWMSVDELRVMWYRVKGPTWVGAVKIVSDEIVKTAPILDFTMGWSKAKLFRYCSDLGWTMTGMLNGEYNDVI